MIPRFQGSNLDRVLAVLRDEASTLRLRFGVLRIGVFGSMARGEDQPHSDLDVLVTLKDPSFDRYMELKFHLEDRFARSVDLVMESALKPRIRDQVLREVRYAA